MSRFPIAAGPVPDALEGIVALHADYYRPHWGFGPFFQDKVARDLGDFLGRYDPARDGLWTVSADGQIAGSVAIDGSKARTVGAHLRWFIVEDRLQGQGLGGQLLEAAMDHCRACGCRRVYLWTFAGLDPARHLYERKGFVLAEELTGSQWGTEVLEQRFEWTAE